MDTDDSSTLDGRGQNVDGRRSFLKKVGIAGVIGVGGLAVGELLSSRTSLDTPTSSITSTSPPSTDTTTETETSTSTVTSTSTAAGGSAGSTSDAFFAYQYLGPSGTVQLTRDLGGNISQLTYGPTTLKIDRDNEGMLTAVHVSIPTDGISQDSVVNRNLDGSIASISVKTSTGPSATSGSS